MIKIFVLIICFILILIGIVGIILPALPGVPLVFLGLLVYGIYTHFTTISLATIIMFLLMSLLSVGISYTSGLYSAKLLGATKYGLLGGFIGLIVGIFFSPFGLVSVIIAPFLGMVLGELIGGKKILESSKVGLGTLIGYLATLTVDLIIAGIMIYVFIRAVF